MYQKTAHITAEKTGATIVAGNPKAVVQKFTNDTRRIKEGSCFVCFVGENSDGNNYTISAVQAGAKSVVMTRPAEADEIAAAEKAGAVLLRAKHDDPYEFLQVLASSYRKEEGWLTVGITGSVGKTTTRQMTKPALSSTFKTFSNEGNFNSAIGVPLTILNAPEGQEVFVCEMGMDHKGEINQIAKAALPNVGCITNIGHAHIGNLGSKENIARAKAEMVRWIAKAPTVLASHGKLAGETVKAALFLDEEDEYTSFIEKEFAKKEGVKTLLLKNDVQDSKLGESPKSLFGLTRNIQVRPEGTSTFLLCLLTKEKTENKQKEKEKEYEVACPLLGKQMVTDALFALAIASYLGCDLEKAIGNIESMQSTAMRASLEKIPGIGCIIDDSYNANAVSMTASIDTLKAMKCNGKKVAILGEMAELGSEAIKLHEEVGAYAANAHVNALIFVGEKNAEVMYNAAIAAGSSLQTTFQVKDAQEAKAVLSSILRGSSENEKTPAQKQKHHAEKKEDAPDNLILVKGSRFLELDRIAKEMKE